METIENRPPETLSPMDCARVLIDTALTPREKEVAVLIARGLSNHDIASALGISVRTYDVHRFHALKKLYVANTVQLTHMLIRAGIVTP